MREINHPFPYADPAFVETYNAFLDAGKRQDLSAALRCRAQLKAVLRIEDDEYLVWQMWKEGLPNAFRIPAWQGRRPGIIHRG